MRRRLLDDYVQVFANRDIRELLAVESSGRFEQFLRLVATRTGHVLNVNGLAVELGIPVTTIRRWLGALQRSFLVDFIPAYSRNAGHRVTKAPKLFLVDSALALAAAREPEPTGDFISRIFLPPTWESGEIAALGQTCTIHWWLQAGQEVDCVLDLRNVLLPVEVKTSAGVRANDARHLVTFLDRYPAAWRGLLISADPLIRMIRPKVIAAPWWVVL